MLRSTFQEIKIPVPWGHISGKWWQPNHSRPILALHGMQDCCGSFDRLIPKLKNDTGFLAIDLPGHGYSSRLPNGVVYHPMLNTIAIKHICDHFQWKKVSLMGHSLGGISSFIYTMLFPETVDFLICLDGIKPLCFENNSSRMAKSIKNFLKYSRMLKNGDEPPSYPLEEIRQKVSELNNNAINMEVCHHILDRNVSKSVKNPNNFYFTRDPRLKTEMFQMIGPNWAQQDIIEGAYRVISPILITKFIDGGYYEKKENFYEILEVLKKSSTDLRFHYIEGSHYTHLNHPEKVANIIDEFIQTHMKDC